MKIDPGVGWKKNGLKIGLSSLSLLSSLGIGISAVLGSCGVQRKEKGVLT